jgi:hypothetical protein
MKFSRLSGGKTAKKCMSKTFLGKTGCAVFIVFLLVACSGNEQDGSGEFTQYNSIPMTAEAEWARRVASLRVDDAGTNNGRTRIAVLEVLLGIRERLIAGNVTPELRNDIEVARDATERMLSSANASARDEWRVLSGYFVSLENQLASPEEALVTLEFIISRLDG